MQPVEVITNQNVLEKLQRLSSVEGIEIYMRVQGVKSKLHIAYDKVLDALYEAYKNGATIDFKGYNKLAAAFSATVTYKRSAADFIEEVCANICKDSVKNRLNNIKSDRELNAEYLRQDKAHEGADMDRE